MINSENQNTSLNKSKSLVRIITDIFLIIGLISSATIAAILYNTKDELQNQISKRDNLIKRSQASDSLSCEHAEQYVKTVTKYISNDCSLTVDGKKISLGNFIKIYSQKEDELIKAQNSLNSIYSNVGAIEKDINERERTCSAIRDTLVLYKQRLKTIEKTYGIATRVRYTDKYTITSYEAKKIDSALVLLSIYRKRMSYDSLSRTWTVRGR